MRNCKLNAIAIWKSFIPKNCFGHNPSVTIIQVETGSKYEAHVASKTLFYLMVVSFLVW